MNELSCERFSAQSTNVLRHTARRQDNSIREGCLNKLLRTALKTGQYFLEQSDKATAPIREKVKDQVEGLTDRTHQAILGPGTTPCVMRSVLTAGIGLGIALGMLFAPASGKEIRRSIVEKAEGRWRQGSRAISS